MIRTSARTALTAAGVGAVFLLAGCGPSGGSGAVQSPAESSTGVDAGTTSEVQSPQTSSTTDSAPATTSGTGTGSTSHASAPQTTQQPTTSSPGDKPVPRCTVDQLKLSLGAGDFDMQGSHRPLRFTNISNTVCKLTGAPGVSYVAGDDGHQVGRAADRIVGHQPVVLIPNATASAGLFLSSAPRKSDCQQVAVRGLRVYPPDSYRSAYLPLPEVTCKPPQSRSYLKVGPILPGPNNSGV